MVSRLEDCLQQLNIDPVNLGRLGGGGDGDGENKELNILVCKSSDPDSISCLILKFSIYCIHLVTIGRN